MHQGEEPTLESKLQDMNDDADKVPLRTRPTNNQLLYKAYFRWDHYPVARRAVYEYEETDACASVTAAFWQVMCTLQEIEALHCRAEKTNILKILSQDTRHTKIVNLACGTHKVSEELKKHSYIDDEGTQFTTNLDRNRYGTDNQYMVTVIQYNLSLLGLCPCLVDVEVLDQKSNETRMISAEIQRCTCEDDDHQGWSLKGGVHKKDKHASDGQSCSPGSSTHSEDKTCWKSNTSNGARGRTDSNRNPRSFNGGQSETKSQTLSKYPSSALLQGFDCVTTRRQRRNKWKKSPIEIQEPLPFSMDSYKSESPPYGAVVNGDYFKRTREVDGMLGETSNLDRTFNESNYNTKSKGQKIQQNNPSSNFDTKRFKSNFQQLDPHSERLFEDVKIGPKFGHPMTKNIIEEDRNRIERLEKEIMFLRKQLRSVGDPNEVEAKVNTHRRSVGQLLEVLHQITRTRGLHYGAPPQPENQQTSENELKQILNCFNSVKPSFEERFSCLGKEQGKKEFDNAVTQWISNPLNQASLLSEFSVSPTNKHNPQTTIKTDPTSAEKLNLGVECPVTQNWCPGALLGLGYDSMLSLEGVPQSLLPSVTWNSPETRLIIGRKLGNL